MEFCKAAGCLALALVFGQRLRGAEWIREQGERGASVVDGVIVEPWGEIDGEEVVRYTLDNGSMKVRINHGATVTECLVPSAAGGELVDVVLGFDDLDTYREKSPTSVASLAVVKTASPPAN